MKIDFTKVTNIEMEDVKSSEIWKDVVGFENEYKVLSLGRVKSLKRVVNNGHKGRVLPELILKPYLSSPGYFTIKLKSKHYQIHRISCFAFLGVPENKMDVNHKNGIKTDNRISNLEWCTRKNNIIHAVKTGLIKIGENRHSSLLTDDNVQEIKEARKIVPQRILAAKFGVCRSHISAIQRNVVRINK